MPLLYWRHRPAGEERAMSDEQPGSDQQGQSAQPEPPAGDPWGDPISEKRQAELQSLLDAWNAPGADHGGKKGPFYGERLTGAEVHWLAEPVRAADRTGSKHHIGG